MYEIDKKKFGAFVSEHRKAKGYTQKALAERLFISDKAISKWETGMSIPDAALWMPLADILGVTVTELLLSQDIEKSSQMTSDQVETLVKQAIHCSEENPVRAHQIRRQRIAAYCISLLVCCAENLFLFLLDASIVPLLTFDLLGIIFGAYAFLLAKEKLPAYYDENRITSYSNGFFRMNTPGLALNNSNWPHIMDFIRTWTISILVGYPALYGVLCLQFPSVWNAAGTYLTLAIVLGGLFIPLYLIGKKYE
ncbi:MAG: helix-turn-helix transcriptional regulator [Lachnospiraceae bacterium]|nr:helix-turn-helix transcriptional regulator [Lachnospiraceae bacterium]